MRLNETRDILQKTFTNLRGDERSQLVLRERLGRSQRDAENEGASMMTYPRSETGANCLQCGEVVGDFDPE
jgi:hypothetical protein